MRGGGGLIALFMRRGRRECDGEVVYGVLTGRQRNAAIPVRLDGDARLKTDRYVRLQAKLCQWSFGMEIFIQKGPWP